MIYGYGSLEKKNCDQHWKMSDVYDQLEKNFFL